VVFNMRLQRTTDQETPHEDRHDGPSVSHLRQRPRAQFQLPPPSPRRWAVKLVPDTQDIAPVEEPDLWDDAPRTQYEEAGNNLHEQDLEYLIEDLPAIREDRPYYYEPPTDLSAGRTVDLPEDLWYYSPRATRKGSRWMRVEQVTIRWGRDLPAIAVHGTLVRKDAWMGLGVPTQVGVRRRDGWEWIDKLPMEVQHYLMTHCLS
jgi:hypothetical protein